jgi:hypothetical protein
MKTSGSRSPRAAVRTDATPPHLLARCIDAEREVRLPRRWAPITKDAPHWRLYVGPD